MRKVETRKVSCCVVGGGPAGVMTGLLLGRAGVETLVLEKHQDFFRDFRGDTVHPSTLDVITELGWLQDFLQRPHQELTQLKGFIEGNEITIADFHHVPTQNKFLALMPQWDFLDFLTEHALKSPQFKIKMNAQVTDLIESHGRIKGVQVDTPEGPVSILTDLVIAADGRHSILRERAQLTVREQGAPMDVLWMRLSRNPGDPRSTLGWIQGRRLLVLLDRGDYWQVGFIIRKGGFDKIKSKGIQAFREELAAVAAPIRNRVHELRSFEDVKLLVVAVNRLKQWWRPGLLFIGDAAHAMSPIGGVGINLAIQDAVATAKILTEPLLKGTLSNRDLQRVQRRREFPTRTTQAMQVFLQKRVIDRVLSLNRPVRLGLTLRLINRFPLLQRIPAFLIGVGVRPEHI